jgi:hypothetical protein
MGRLSMRGVTKASAPVLPVCEGAVVGCTGWYGHTIPSVGRRRHGIRIIGVRVEKVTPGGWRVDASIGRVSGSQRGGRGCVWGAQCM